MGEATDLINHVNSSFFHLGPCSQKSEKQKMVNLSARSPIFHENMFFDDVLEICFKKSVFCFTMFCHTGCTESYESLMGSYDFVNNDFVLQCFATPDSQNDMNH